MSSRTVSIALPLPDGRRAWLAAGVALGLLAASIAGPLLGTHHALAVDPGTTTNEHTISVSGTGRVVLSPDTADLRLGVGTTAKTVKEARAKAAASMTAVIASLKKLGIADADIQTSTLSLQPTYDYQSNQNPPRITGYSMSNAVSVTIRDLDKVGDAIDDALAAGATSLDGVSFRVNDQTAAEKQAREAAMADATAKSKALADAAHVSITGVASISETSAPVPYPVYYGFAAGAADMKTPVQPGTNEISVTVSVVYLIG
jgi:uncharacterized protein YggE